MKSQACEPCAKRKVRCDRAEPSCTNCKRRKQDHCAYPDHNLPHQRIERLEKQVRDLGGDPSSEGPGEPSPSVKVATLSESTASTVAQTPVIVQQDGRSVYVESEGWRMWTRLGESAKSNDTSHGSIHNVGRPVPHAFQTFPWGEPPPHAAIAEECPLPAHEAIRLWDAFMERVEPLVKITFDWTLQQLRSSLLDPERWRQLSQGEHVQILSVCLLGVVSLSDDECMEDFGQPKSTLLLQHRTQCEALFARINLLAVDNMSVLKALCLYMRAGIENVTSQSLWSLMGLACRSAELLGIHRDGQILGLSPAETEDRRRLWWQLQHLDLILSIKCGVSPLTFSANWDVKLPLNIEDSDIRVASKTLPKERSGLTSMSHTLFSYWLIQQQRSYYQERLNHHGFMDRSILSTPTEELINQLEAGLNEKFLQHCDPIQPVQVLIQISARAVICVLRIRRIHEMRLHSEQFDAELQEYYFDTCMRALRYVVVSHSHPLLKPFQWLTEGTFTWYAFVGVLGDMLQLSDVAKIKAAWTLLADMYDTIASLFDLSADRRRLHAASSIVATWNACQHRPGLELMEKPAFVAKLESRISQFSTVVDDNGSQESSNDQGRAGVSAEADIWQVREDMNELLSVNFADIDWAFWEGIR